MILRHCDEAAAIANRYNWPEYPGIVDQIRAGRIPYGFGRTVGQTIALFKRSWPFGRRDPEGDDYHAKQLARLRLLIAQINLAGKP